MKKKIRLLSTILIFFMSMQVVCMADTDIDLIPDVEEDNNEGTTYNHRRTSPLKPKATLNGGEVEIEYGEGNLLLPCLITEAGTDRIIQSEVIYLTNGKGSFCLDIAGNIDCKLTITIGDMRWIGYFTN